MPQMLSDVLHVQIGHCVHQLLSSRLKQPTSERSADQIKKILIKTASFNHFYVLQQPYMGWLLHILEQYTCAQVIFQHAFTAVIAKVKYLQTVASKQAYQYPAHATEMLHSTLIPTQNVSYVENNEANSWLATRRFFFFFSYVQLKHLGISAPQSISFLI